MSQDTAASGPTYYVSAIEVRLAMGSRKIIRSIKLYKNDQPPRDVEKIMNAGDEHREEFVPPLSVSLSDHISALVSHRAQFWCKKAVVPIEISLRDDERKPGENVYRKIKNNVDVVVTVYPQVPPLVATTTQIIQACSQFRILIIGNSGVGKSTLIREVFGVQAVEPSQNARGQADINQEFVSQTNERFVVHDSLGFEAGDEGHMDIVKKFVTERKGLPEVKDQLHAIWLCLEIPYAGGRLLETGVEGFLQRRKDILGDIPLVVVLTKLDLLNAQLELETPEGMLLEDAKSQFLGERCVKPLYIAAGNDVTHVAVSSREGYSDTLSKLLKATDENMIKYRIGDAPRVLATIAQRISIKEKIELSITIGKKKYWKMLTRRGDFHGRTLQACLQVIRKEIIDVWNFNDPDKCLMDDEITGNIFRNDNLEGDSSPGIVDASSDGSSSAGFLAWGLQKWKELADSQNPTLSVLPFVAGLPIVPVRVYETYQEAKKDVKMLMAYIVDLMCIMQIVFLLASGDRVTKKTINLAVKVYEGQKREIHHLIRECDENVAMLPGGRDYALEKIQELIWRFGISDEEIQETRKKLAPIRKDLMTPNPGSS